MKRFSSKLLLAVFGLSFGFVSVPVLAVTATTSNVPALERLGASSMTYNFLLTTMQANPKSELAMVQSMQIKQQAELIRLEKEQVSLQKRILATVSHSRDRSIEDAMSETGSMAKFAGSMNMGKTKAFQTEMAKDTQEISGSFNKGVEAEQAKLSK